MSDDTWEVVVVGAGVVGSWAAYHLAHQGVPTLLLEQFPLPHTRGSSNGPTRLIRKFYDKDEYMRMMPESYDWWHRIEAQSKVQLYVNTSMLAVQAAPTDYLKEGSAAMKRQNMKHTWLNHEELSRQFPMFRFTKDYSAIYDPGAGMLYSNKCLQVLQELFRKFGGTIQDGVQVTSVKEVGDVVVLQTRKGSYRAKKVVLCPGPWAKELIQTTGLNLPLMTMPGRQAYYRARDESKHDVTNGVPIMIDEIRVPGGGYQFVIVKPMAEFPGLVKVATRGKPLIKAAHPDERDKNEEKEVYDNLRQYVTRHLPYVDPEPCITENCVYTMTPDRDFVLDRHPTMKNVVIGAGFSGHGFKSAPVTGKLLVQMALQQPLSYDTSRWRINRFNKSKL